MGGSLQAVYWRGCIESGWLKWFILFFNDSDDQVLDQKVSNTELAKGPSQLLKRPEHLYKGPSSQCGYLAAETMVNNSHWLRIAQQRVKEHPKSIGFPSVRVSDPKTNARQFTRQPWAQGCSKMGSKMLFCWNPIIGCPLVIYYQLLVY